VTTANEIYLPVGRTVNFRLRSADVIHSFWTPQLGGKRDVVTNRTNYIWYTPDSAISGNVWNGFCVEYCGASHANMRFRVFTVSQQQFDSWVAGQKMPARFGAVAPAAAATGSNASPNGAPAMSTPGGPNAPSQAAQAAAPGIANRSSGTGPAGGNQPAIARGQNPGANPGARTGAAATAAPATSPGAIEAGYIFPRDKIPEYAIPHAPVPSDLKFTAGLTGNAARGKDVFSGAACIGCHSIAGNPIAMGVLGPNLTHVGSRSTIAAGRFPNAAAYLALWIKNARKMKPEVLMPTLGLDEYDPVLKAKVTSANGGLSDQQIADIVAYLTALK
jgi:cytochrome c oxidase subunit 2